MPLPFVGQRPDCCWGSKISKESQKYPKQWLWRMNFQKTNCTSWILNLESTKICQHILPMTSSNGAKIAFSIELFSKNCITTAKLKTLPKPQTLFKCYDASLRNSLKKLPFFKPSIIQKKYWNPTSSLR